MGKNIDIIDPLYQYLKKKKPENLLIPCTAHKNPLYKHKNNAWNWNKVVEHGDDFGPKKYQAILMKDMIVIDIDDKQLIQKYENMFPILTICPKAETTKGAHYYFNRTIECDLSAMYDHSRCFGVGKDEVDFKSICSTGTAGVVVVPPTKGKTWVRPLWDTPLSDFDGDIFNYFYDNWGSRRYVYNIKADPSSKTKKHTIIDDIEEDSTFNKVNLTNDDFNEIENLVECLSENRSRDYPTWINVCWCLKNIYAQYNDPENTILQLWLNFSSLTQNKYVKEESLDKWYKTIPRKSGYKIGSLKIWAKEDNFQKYNNIIENNKNFIDEIVKKQIKNMIKLNFHHPPTKVSSITLKEYDNQKYIFANIDETFCNICDDVHNECFTIIIINNEHAYEKCKLTNNKSNYIKISGDLNNSINEILHTIVSPEKAILEFVNNNAEIDNKIKEMNITEISEKTESIMGCKFDITNNILCPLHHIVHESPCNYMYVNVQMALLAIACTKSPLGQLFPQHGMVIPKDTLNIITGNTIIQNNYYNGDENGVDNNGIPIDDNYAARRFVELMNGRICFTDNKLWIYNDKNGLWSTDENDLNIQILNHERNLQFTANIKNTTIMHNYSGMLQKKLNMIKCIPQFCTINKFFDCNKIKSGFGKILFDDCIYDMDKQIFIEFNSDIVFFDKISRSRPIRDQQLIDMLNEKLFVEPYIDIKNGIRFKQEIALAIHGGFTHRRKLISGHGVSSSSKGLMTDCCLQTFEEYCGIYTLSNIVKDKWSPNDSKCYGFCIDIAKKRMAWANESDNTLKLSTSILNTTISGGDTFKARYLGKNPVYIVNYATMFAMTNNILKFDNNNDAVNDRYDGAINFEIAFKDKPDPNNIYQKLKDPTLRADKIKTREYKDAFFWIIMDEFQNLKNLNDNFTKIPIELAIPDTFYEEVESCNSNQKIIDIFSTYYEPCDNKKQFITLNDITNRINLHSNGEFDDKSAIKKELQQHGLIFDMKSTTYKSEKIRGKLYGYTIKGL